MLTITKNFLDENKSQKRINVKKIISLKEIIEKKIKDITFNFENINELETLKKLNITGGITDVKILLRKGSDLLTFKLKNKRKIDNKLLNSLNLTKNIVSD